MYCYVHGMILLSERFFPSACKLIMSDIVVLLYFLFLLVQFLF